MPPPEAQVLLVAIRPQVIGGGGVCPIGGSFWTTEAEALDLVKRGLARYANQAENDAAGDLGAQGPSEVQDKGPAEVKAPAKPPRWTLRQPPAEYLAANPEGPMAELAKAILAAEAAKKAG